MEDIYLPAVTKAVEAFFTKNNRYPTVNDFHHRNNLPSARSIQRCFGGGLTRLRELLNLPLDMRKNREESIRKQQERNYYSESKMENFLVSVFGRQFVHKQSTIVDNTEHRADFKVFFDGGDFVVDVFTPQDKHSLSGCLNWKQRKHGLIGGPKVYFVNMNPDITDTVVTSIIENKIKKLSALQVLMNFTEFQSHVKEFIPLQLSRPTRRI